jgi:alkylation response protein AidB-like acyl-CoA dehydrogenase
VQFDLSADQRELAGAARDLLDGHASSERVRKVLNAGVDAELWTAMAEQGWPVVALPEDAGGLGLTWVEACVLAEQVGYHVAPAPFAGAVLATRALAAAGEAALLEQIAGGQKVASVAWAGGLAVDAPSADVLVHVTPDSVTLHEIATRPEPTAAMDVTRQVTRVEWSALGSESVLGGPDLATDLLDAGATLYAAELLGVAQRVLDMSVAYAGVREQFGKPIGSFQAVKHRCADMLVDVEGIRSASWYASWAVATGAPDASLAASTAKAWASDAANRVAASGLQVHGGIGFTWEHDLHLFLKRAQLSSVVFGDATWHRERLASLLKARVEAGEPVF